MEKCFKDLLRDDLKPFKKQFPDMDVDLVLSWVAIVKRAHWILNLVDAYHHRHELSHGRFGVLIELMRRQGSCSPAKIAEHYGAKSATITGLLDHLERDGLVERTPNPDDRRRVDVQITDKGRAFMEDFLPRQHMLMEEALSELTDDERKAMISGLSKMYSGIHRHLENIGAEKPYSFVP